MLLIIFFIKNKSQHEIPFATLLYFHISALNRISMRNYKNLFTRNLLDCLYQNGTRTESD